MKTILTVIATLTATSIIHTIASAIIGEMITISNIDLFVFFICSVFIFPTVLMMINDTEK